MVNKQLPQLWITIKQMRLKKGLSQDQLARKAGVPYTTFVKTESGIIKNPSVYVVVKIAKALEMTIDDLIYKK